MVEFSDPGAVSRATRMTGAELFGSKLTIRPSNKSQFIGEPKGDVYTLLDKSPGYSAFKNRRTEDFILVLRFRKRLGQPLSQVFLPFLF